MRSLQEHPEIIPFDGVLGGTMGFYGESEIHLLAPNWVYAKFDDGHILGHGVFEYEIQKDKTLKWKVVRAELED